jgi:predicted PurR-regulated permease PerM
LAGIIGALLAVPTVAFLNSAIRVLAAREPEAEIAALDEDEGKVIEADADDIELATKDD